MQWRRRGWGTITAQEKESRGSASIIIEVNQWDHADELDEDISVFIRKDLDELNRNAGIQHRVLYTVVVTVVTRLPQRVLRSILARYLANILDLNELIWALHDLFRFAEIMVQWPCVLASILKHIKQMTVWILIATQYCLKFEFWLQFCAPKGSPCID